MVNPSHWDGLPDGHTRATTTGSSGDFDDVPGNSADRNAGEVDNPLSALITANPAAATPVTVRSLADYDHAANPGGRP